MLMLKLGWLVLLWLSFNVKNTLSQTCPLKGQTPPTLHGIHNYVIDTLSGGYFPFAIGQCTSIEAVPTNKWYKYMCKQTTSGWMVTKTEYFSQFCTGSGILVSTFTSKNGTEDGIDTFECNGINSYAKIELSLSSSCNSSVTVYAALDTCISVGKNQFQIFCNNSVAFFEFFHTNVSLVANETTETTPMPQTTNLPQATNLKTTLLNTLLGNSSLLNISSIMSTTSLLHNISAMISTTALLRTTSISTSTPQNYSEVELCENKDYCEAWILPMGKCVLANTSSFRSHSINIYGQLMSCKLNVTSVSNVNGTASTTKAATTTSTSSSTSTTIVSTKSESTRFQLAISVIITLLLTISWL